MQPLIVVCAMLFAAVTPFLSRWEAPDTQWSDEESGAVLSADIPDAEAGEAEREAR